MFRGATKKEKACGRKSGGSRGPAAAVGAEVVSYKGSVVNIPSLLQALEAADRTRKALELRIATLQDALGTTHVSFFSLTLTHILLDSYYISC